MSTFVAPLIYVMAFVAIVLVIQTIAGFFFKTGDTTRKVNRRLTMLQSGMKPVDVYSALVRKSSTPAVGNERLRHFFENMDLYCRQAGVATTPLRIVGIAAAAAGVIWLVSLFVLRTNSGVGMLVNGVSSLFGAIGMAVVGTWFFLSRKRNARLRKVEDQMPLALDIVNRAIRAGHPVVSAVQLAADEMGDPIGSEFGLVVDETTYGAEFRDALTNFAHRTGSPDAHFFAVSVSIQSETGGNLAEILQGLATVIRARATLAKRVKALASEGKASVVVLSALPVLMVSVLFVFQPKFYTSKFDDPLFWPVAACVVLLYIIGQFFMNRIVNFKY